MGPSLPGLLAPHRAARLRYSHPEQDGVWMECGRWPFKDADEDQTGNVDSE